MNNEKIKYIADHYGIKNQNRIAIEEMSELTKVICKIGRYPAMDPRVSKYMDELIEEIADVSIMVEQLRYFYGAEVVDAMIEKKLDRQIKRIQMGCD